ncbi:lipopolysaccharide biosynthesis protein [Streptomyces sp. NBC_01481]|uniref:lipopolysaccharide biosynthesis protein n=1 Tax=Streptomyces sp. NBC_01481 TaxID=2975869 RepID=UPI002259FA4D|nr:polysaccharide biosynthesis C-terminal domain-containing protein [Streptomyces sp. NBC_01481]MCX4585378.1 polysaccharide biosynthesis C-terminal domain-containing protein [Streptomyces sp. NBC_01481]
MLSILGSRAACLVLSVLTSAVIARSLEPEGRGIYYMAVTVATTATMLGHLSGEQAQSALWTDAGRREELAGNCVPLALVLGTLSGLAGTALVTVIGPETLDLPGGYLVMVSCLSVPLGIASNYASNIALLQGRVQVANWSMLTAAIGQCAAVAVLAAGERLNVVTGLLVWVATGAAPLVVFTAFGVTAGRRRDLELARTTVVTGARYHLGPASVFLLMNADIYLLSAFAGAREVGIYSLAVGLAGYSRLLADVVSQVMLKRQFTASDTESADVTVRITRYAVLLALASALVLTLSAPVLVSVVYGAAYADAVPLVMLLAPGVMALGATRLPSAYLLRLRRAKLVVVPSVIALVVNIVLNLLLIPVWGAVGCALASSLAYVLLAAFQTRLFTRVTGIRARNLLPVTADLLTLIATARRCVPGKHAAASLPPG